MVLIHVPVSSPKASGSRAPGVSEKFRSPYLGGTYIRSRKPPQSQVPGREGVPSGYRPEKITLYRVFRGVLTPLVIPSKTIVNLAILYVNRENKASHALIGQTKRYSCLRRLYHKLYATPGFGFGRRVSSLQTKPQAFRLALPPYNIKCCL